MFNGITMENPTPMDLLLKERADQTAKGHTPETDVKNWQRYDLKEIACALVSRSAWPKSLPVATIDKWKKKPYHERLAMAAAFLLAEIARNQLEDAQAKAAAHKMVNLESMTPEQLAELETRIAKIKQEAAAAGGGA